MDERPEDVEAGHAFYTPRSLKIYDLAILVYFSRVAWRCPAPRIVDHYNRHVTSNHLDVGVGTGYFLDHCRFPDVAPRIGLLDLSTACLDKAAARVARFTPEVHVANVLEPIAIDTPKFDSVAINYVLHCLPGTIQSKAVVFEHLKRLANPGSVMFGATLLHDGVHRNFLARQVMSRNNRHGIFSNQHDDLDGLRAALNAHLDEPEVTIIGCVALFAGRVPAHAA